MTSILKYYALTGLLGTLSLTALPVAAQAQSSPEAIAPLPEQTLPVEEVPQPSVDIQQQTGQAPESLNCPPGQFPSAFADVLPFHWAYTAVNNLASVSMQCFDLPEEYR